MRADQSLGAGNSLNTPGFYEIENHLAYGSFINEKWVVDIIKLSVAFYVEIYSLMDNILHFLFAGSTFQQTIGFFFAGRRSFYDVMVGFFFAGRRSLRSLLVVPGASMSGPLSTSAPRGVAPRFARAFGRARSQVLSDAATRRRIHYPSIFASADAD
jgi:hypothetical protein